MLLVLPLTRKIPSILKKYIKDPGALTSYIDGCVSYLVDSALALRTGESVDLLDYIPTNDIQHGDLSELKYTLDWYVPYVLNVMVINNIDNPYIVNSNEHSFTIVNKEEYT